MDLIVFSHLRWDFVYQRPQHLLSRFAHAQRVFYVEEPHFDAASDGYTVKLNKDNVWIVQISLTGTPAEQNNVDRQKVILSKCLADNAITSYMTWYYTPLALLISDHLKPRLVVYDCMDELANFKHASPVLKHMEDALFKKADVVFTGGHSLYAAKKDKHNNIHPFPSSIDKNHFAQARQMQADPADQAVIPQPRFGYYGVIDERFDINLIAAVAAAKPDWHFVLVGPVVKIDANTLPQAANIHYLGGKSYAELPHYLGGWDIALIPFKRDASTRFISPTKTPEYLAGGKPVISTTIQDVVHPYGVEHLVYIADDAAAFIACAERELAIADKSDWLARVDAFLAHVSWDQTWQDMVDLINQKLTTNFILTVNHKEYHV